MCDAYLFLTEKVYDAGLRKHQLTCAVVTVQSLSIVFVVGDRVQRPVCVVNVAVTQFKRAPAAVSTRRLEFHYLTVTGKDAC